MLEATRERLLESIPDDAVVLDIGGWADPFERADWMIDVAPYETRGLYELVGWKEPPVQPVVERYCERTWIQRDICDREPFPFADNEIDFVICSQTLEDIRDPVWVCTEMARIAKRGYIEVPSRLEEQSWGVEGEYVGYRHHRWLVDVVGSELQFTLKPHDIHFKPEFHFSKRFYDSLTAEERVCAFWWEGSFAARERITFLDGAEHAAYADFVSQQMSMRGFPQRRGGRSRLSELRGVVSRLRRGPSRSL